MSSQSTDTKQTTTTTTTTTSSSRRDVGSGGSGFTKPVAENDRDGPQGNAALIEDMAMGGMLGGMFGPLGMMAGAGLGAAWGAVNNFLGDDEKWGEVEQTTAETLEQSGMVQKYGDDAVLVIANGPEDMKQLDHDAEANQIAENRGDGQETVVLWNPSPDALSTMLSEGGFKDVVVSGHGDEGVVYMTGADGEAVAVDGQTLAGMFEGSSVENVFLNVCHGLGGENSVADSFAEAGMNVMGWDDKVSDGTAQQGAGRWAEMMADGSDMFDLFSTASDFEGLSARLGQGRSLFPNGIPGLGGFFGPSAGPAAGPAAPGPAAAAGPKQLGPVKPEPAPAEESSFLDDLFTWDMGLTGWL